MSVVTASDEMPYALAVTQLRRLTLSSSTHRFTVTMAANVIDEMMRDPIATRAILEEFHFFLATFRQLGASGEVTVTDVYNYMKDRGLPAHWIRGCMENADPTANAPTTAARGKNVSRLLSFSKSCQCTMQFVYFCRKRPRNAL